MTVARYVNGHLGDIGVPITDPMDFSAWIEVFLDGAWHTFDPRNNVPRIGRIVVARGRDAADIPLINSFCPHVLVAAVHEGRAVYDNVKKVISWTLPTSAGEAMTIVVALLAGLTLPVTAVLILWVNLVTAVTLGVALAFEPSEPSIMHRPPRPRDESLLTGELVWHIVLISILIVMAVLGLYFYAIGRGYPVALAPTIAMNTLVVLEIFHLFFIRNIYGTSLT